MEHKEKVRRLKLHNAVFRRNFTAFLEYQRQRDEADRKSLLARLLTGKRVRLVLPDEPEYEPYPDIRGLRCGARTRKGTPCKMTNISTNGRCKFHGGLSTGAKTKAGRKRQRDGYRAWLEKQRASKVGRKRTRTYIDDTIGIDSAILAEISTGDPGNTLLVENGIGLTISAERTLLAALPGGGCVTVQLTTTSPAYGGVRWWYVCPECKSRKAALYVSGAILLCRRCAGIHYASQSR
jgi:hypothetical protein